MKKQESIIKKVDSSLAEVYPTFVDTQNPKYIEINDCFASSIFIYNYNIEMERWLFRTINFF